MRPNLLALFESVYDLELHTEDWLSGILGQLRTWIGDGPGLFSFTYSVSSADELIPQRFATMGCAPIAADELPFAVTQIGSDVVRDAYLSTNSCAASAFAGWRTSGAAEIARRDGVAEVWFVNGRSGENRGCALCVNRRTLDVLPAKERRLLARLSEHLAAAHRVRERLRFMDAIERAEAVIAPCGAVLHAVGNATGAKSIEALSTGVLALEKTRGKLGRNGVARSGPWKGFVAARWTLLEHFDSDGRRYILARENESPRATKAALSSRERQVLANAVLGQSNKEIANTLGIAHSTVRVLLLRATAKLGVRTRVDAILRFRELSALDVVTGGPLSANE